MVQALDQFGNSVDLEAGVFYDKKGKQILCAFSDCKLPARLEFRAPVWDETQHHMLWFCFCSWEHQAQQLAKWGEL
jgi:hypothetical protein